MPRDRRFADPRSGPTAAFLRAACPEPYLDTLDSSGSIERRSHAGRRRRVSYGFYLQLSEGEAQVDRDIALGFVAQTTDRSMLKPEGPLRGPKELGWEGKQGI